MPLAQTSVPCLGLESQGSRTCAWGPWLLVAIVTGFARELIPPLLMSTLVGARTAVIPPCTLLCAVREPWSLVGPVFYEAVACSGLATRTGLTAISPSVSVAFQRLSHCLPSTDSVHQGCRQWPTSLVSCDCQGPMSLPGVFVSLCCV